MGKDRLSQLEDKLRRIDRERVAKHADERNQRVLSEINKYHTALAQKYEISLEDLHKLLSDSESWFNFLKSKRDQSAISTDESIAYHAKQVTIPKSVKGRTTRFKTGEWDPKFHLYHQMMSEGD